MHASAQRGPGLQISRIHSLSNVWGTEVFTPNRSRERGMSRKSAAAAAAGKKAQAQLATPPAKRGGKAKAAKGKGRKSTADSSDSDDDSGIPTSPADSVTNDATYDDDADGDGGVDDDDEDDAPEDPRPPTATTSQKRKALQRLSEDAASSSSSSSSRKQRKRLTGDEANQLRLQKLQATFSELPDTLKAQGLMLLMKSEGVQVREHALCLSSSMPQHCNVVAHTRVYGRTYETDKA